jgi:UDP-glucose 4-epimerase
VVDLARGHLKALEKIGDNTGLSIYNLGTGLGYSVLDMVRAFEKAAGRPIPYRIAPRRPGDIAECFADPTKAHQELGWRAEKGVDDMCRDALKWQTANPNGYNQESTIS